MITKNIPDKQLEFMDNSDKLWVLCDITSRIAYVNDAWYRQCDVKRSEFDATNKIYSEIPCKSFQECSAHFEEHDRNVILAKRSISSLEIHERQHLNGWQATVHTTSPYFNKQDKLIGVIGHAENAPDLFIKKYQNIQEKISLRKREGSLMLKNPENLKDAEFDSVFLLMMNFTPKKIAYIRKVHFDSVYTTLDRVRLKLDLDSNSQLKEFSIEKGWYNYLPKIFRNHETSFVFNHAI